MHLGKSGKETFLCACYVSISGLSPAYRGSHGAENADTRAFQVMSVRPVGTKPWSSVLFALKLSTVSQTPLPNKGGGARKNRRVSSEAEPEASLRERLQVPVPVSDSLQLAAALIFCV